MKKHIWTLWTQPHTDILWDLMCYAISINLVKKLGYPTLIYTDKAGSNLLKKYKIDVDQEIVDFNITYEKIPKYSEAKLYTISLQDEPFCHIDHDVFLFKPQKTFLDSDITIQHTESSKTYVPVYFDGYTTCVKQNVQLPEELHKCARNNDFSGFNCGYIDVKNINVSKEWSNIGLNISKDYYPQGCGDVCLPEQFCLYALAKYRKYKIDSLFVDPVYNEEEATSAGYVHLMSAKKVNYGYVTERLIKRAEELAPEFLSALGQSQINNFLADGVINKKETLYSQRKNTIFEVKYNFYTLINMYEDLKIRNIYIK